MEASGARRHTIALVLAVAAATALTGWLLTGHDGGRSPVAVATPPPPPGSPVVYTVGPEPPAPTQLPTPFAGPPPQTPGINAGAFRVAPPHYPGPLLWTRRDDEQVPGTIRLHAHSWDGVERGTLELGVPQDADAVVAPSPDGSRLLVGGRIVYTSTGAQAGLVTAPSVPGMTRPAQLAWADDSRHLCILAELPNQGPGYHTDLLIELPGGGPAAAPRTIAGEPGGGGDSAWFVAACSAVGDRVVLVHGVDMSSTAVRVVRFSTGAVTYSLDYTPADSVVGAPSSTPDGSFLIEDLGGTASTPDRLRRRDLVTGRAVSVVPNLTPAFPTGAIAVAGDLVVEFLGVVDDRTGAAVFTPPQGRDITGAAARPGGGDLALEVEDQAQQCTTIPCGSPVTNPTTVILHPDGSTWALPSGEALVSG